MARVTVEDCLKNVPNMYEVVLLATKRVRQLAKGSDALVRSKNRLAVTALREIAAGKVQSSLTRGGANHSEDNDDLLDLPH